MPTFEGQRALVIGGSSGMGRGAARALASRGCDVVVTSRSDDRLPAAIDGVAADLRPTDGVGRTGSTHGAVCDLTDAASVRDAIGGMDRLDHLVVTAAPGRGVTDREFFDGKFWGTQVAADAAAGRMPGAGTMLFVSGGLAVRPTVGQWSVTCAFAAVEALARALAVEHAPRRVNCIRPGLFDTGTWAAMAPDEREAFFEQKTDGLAAGRPATPEDFGDAVVGIASSRYLTGQVIVLDGGEALRAD